MFCVNVQLRVKEESQIPLVRELMIRMGQLSRAEPGCLRYEVCHSQSDRSRFLLCERWESQGAWEHHRTLPPFKEIYEPRVMPLVDREPHIADLL